MTIESLLQIIIALIFIYLISSLVVSELQEQFAAWHQFRAKNLKDAIRIFLGENTTKALYEKSLLSAFNQRSDRKSDTDTREKSSTGFSYIEPQVFAESLIAYINTLLDEENKFLKTDLVGDEQGDIKTGILKKLSSLSVGDYIDEQTIKKLREIAYTTKLKYDNPTLENFTQEIALTFNQIMERTSGVYRRNAKGISLIFGLIAAVLFNIDSFYIVNQLYKNPTLTQEINNLANNIDENYKSCRDIAEKDKAKETECRDTAIKELKGIETTQPLPIGWKKNDSSFFPLLQESQNPFFAIFGWLITGVAISMGAPFWFDLLGKVINVRNTGKPISTDAKKP